MFAPLTHSDTLEKENDQNKYINRKLFDIVHQKFTERIKKNPLKKGREKTLEDSRNSEHKSQHKVHIFSAE